MPLTRFRASGQERRSNSVRKAASALSLKPLAGMLPISIQERRDELCRSRTVRCLRRPDLVDDGGGLVCPDRAPPGGGPIWSAAPRLAPGAVRVRFLRDHPLGHRPYRRALRYADVERGTEIGTCQEKRRKRRPASRRERP